MYEFQERFTLFTVCRPFSLLWKDELSAGSSSVIERCGLSTRGEESTDLNNHDVVDSSSTHHHCIGAQWNKHDTFQFYHVREMIIINCFAFHGFCYFCQRNCGVSITLMTIRQLVLFLLKLQQLLSSPSPFFVSCFLDLYIYFYPDFSSICAFFWIQ
eukprot:gene3901-2770_t